MRIAYFESRDEDVRLLRPLLRAHDVSWIPEPLSPENEDVAVAAEAISVSLRSPVSRRALGRLPALRFIATRSTGIDHLDVVACRERRIAVANVPEYGVNTVAEHTFALLLALARRLFEAEARTRQQSFSLVGLEGIELAGRTLGVVGVGRIGGRVVEIGRAFGMRVLATDPSPDPALEARLGFAYVPIQRLLAQSDVVTLHAPLTPATQHLIDDRAFAGARRGLILINSARGELVDTGALLRALDRGVVAAAGLDVLEGEEAIREEAELLERSPSPERGRVLLETHGLINRPNVVVTPHCAFYSREAIDRILQTTAENLNGWAEGHPPNRVV